jgi:hypothetical protein
MLRRGWPTTLSTAGRLRGEAQLVDTFVLQIGRRASGVMCIEEFKGGSHIKTMRMALAALIIGAGVWPLALDDHLRLISRAPFARK